LAGAIESQFETKSQLIKGSGGIFDVKVDGELIYSKHETGRFPTNDEICKILADRSS